MSTLTNILFTGAAVAGGMYAYNRWMKKKQEEKDAKTVGVLQAVGAPVALTTGGIKVVAAAPPPNVPGVVTLPSGAQAMQVPIVPKRRPRARRTSPFGRPTGIRPGGTRSLRPTRAPRTATFTRPQSLSECCDDICITGLKRTVRPRPVLDQHVSFLRNIIEYNGNIC